MRKKPLYCIALGDSYSGFARARVSLLLWPELKGCGLRGLRKNSLQDRFCNKGSTSVGLQIADKKGLALQAAEKLRFGEGYRLQPVRNLFIISTGLYSLRKNSVAARFCVRARLQSCRLRPK